MYAAKAIYAGLVAFVGALVTASLTPGISEHEWLAAALVGLVGGGGTYFAHYAPSPRRKG